MIFDSLQRTIYMFIDRDDECFLVFVCRFERKTNHLEESESFVAKTN
jgi:hypothetical protein